MSTMRPASSLRAPCPTRSVTRSSGALMWTRASPRTGRDGRRASPDADRREEEPMALFNQLTHISVTVTDVAKAREFYSDVLGFQEIDRPAFNFPLLGGDLQLHIILNDALVRPALEREKIEARY